MAMLTDWIDAHELAYTERMSLIFDGEVMYVGEGEGGLILFNSQAAYWHHYCNFYHPL